MDRYINIDKIVPENCPLGYDDCYYCQYFSQDCRGFLCYAEIEDEEVEI